RLDHHRDDPTSRRQLEQLRNALRAGDDVDLLHREPARRERAALGLAVHAAGLEVEQHRPRRHHALVPSTRVAAALNMPPSPSQKAISAPSTWRSPHSLRSCLTASTSRNMPYMPVWVYESPPPLVFMGKAPPGAVRPPATNAPPSPGLQNPVASRPITGTIVNAS